DAADLPDYAQPAREQRIRRGAARAAAAGRPTGRSERGTGSAAVRPAGYAAADGADARADRGAARGGAAEGGGGARRYSAAGSVEAAPPARPTVAERARA